MTFKAKDSKFQTHRHREREREKKNENCSKTLFTL